LQASAVGSIAGDVNTDVESSDEELRNASSGTSKIYNVMRKFGAGTGLQQKSLATPGKKWVQIRIMPYDSIRKNVKFEVSPEVKERLSTAPILQFPHFGREFILTTDASQVAIGAVLSQVGESGEQPVAFARRRLTPPETW
jgi:hypothetical protein